MSYHQAKKTKQKIENRFGQYKKNKLSFGKNVLRLSVNDTGRPMGQATEYMEEVRAGGTNLSH